MKNGFVKEYKGYSIMNTPSKYIITKEGTTVAETKFGIPVCEAIIEELITKENEENKDFQTVREKIKNGEISEIYIEVQTSKIQGPRRVKLTINMTVGDDFYCFLHETSLLFHIKDFKKIFWLKEDRSE